MQAFAAGRLAFVEDRYDDAEEAFRLSIEGFTANAIEIHCWLALRLAARLAEFRGDHVYAIDVLERSVAIARSLGMSGSVNLLLGDLGESLGAAGELDHARDVLAQPLAAAREVGFVRGVCESLAGLALTEWRADEPGRAAGFAAAGLDSARQIDHFEVATFCLVILGWAAGQRGDLQESRTRHLEALRCAYDAALPRATAFAVESLAALAMLEDDSREAAWLLGAASTLRRAPGAAVGVAFAVGAGGESEVVLAAARRAVGDDTVSEAFAAGARAPNTVTSALLAAGPQRPGS
jgi:tetratricopeptide (TPR) repeat protein